MILTPEQVWLDRRDKMNLTELKACGDAMAQQLNTQRIMIEAQLSVKGRIRDEASKRGRDASSAVSELDYLIELIDAQQARIAELEQYAARYREVRRGQHWSVIDGIGSDLRADELDAAIDAAMQKDKTT